MNTSTPPQCNVLIVEDEAALREALRDKLAREGFGVVEAKNGEEGFVAALKHRPDLILLDLIMPRTDGMMLLRRLRSQNEWGKSVPVIILTNLTAADEERNRNITELEPAYYLEKANWKIQDVVAKIRERLGSAT